MNEKKPKILAAAFVLLIIAVAAVMAAVILAAPEQITASTAGNYSCNLANGAPILQDEGFLFYVLPSRKGIWRAKTSDEPGKDAVLITKRGDGYLQTVGGRYYYTDDNGLYSCKSDGSDERLVLNYAKTPHVVGDRVYYKNEDGYICRYTVSSGETLVLCKNETGGFLISSLKLYYIADNGNIRQMRVNGTNDEIFLDVNAVSLCFDDAYMFYLGADGYLYSAAPSNEGWSINRLMKADSFAVCGSYVIYNSGGKCFWLNINDYTKQANISPKQIENESCSGLSVDVFYSERYFYYFTKDGRISRIPYNYDETDDGSQTDTQQERTA